MNQSTAFHDIAESLASNYDVIYYIEVETGLYSEFRSNEILGNLEKPKDGAHFFDLIRKHGELVVYPEDRERVINALSRENLEKELKKNNHFSLDYRLYIDDEERYTRLTATLSSDKSHYVIGVENINDEIRREINHLNALKDANEAARKDMLTGAKNKNAYKDLERAVSNALRMGDRDLKYALVVCDLNDLKRINDELGHIVGDEYIRLACKMLFDTFSHSPVYRIGGDEFAVFLKDRDYYNREALLRVLKNQVLNNLHNGDGAVIAAGISDFDPESDKSLSDVFQRADRDMYENKKKLKAKGQTNSRFLSALQTETTIPADRKQMLDNLFEAFSVVADDSYIFVCDMEHDYSRWSKIAVDTFDLPGEYMFGAGNIWEEHVHPEDRDVYVNSINDIFEFGETRHDMQYRVARPDGSYDLCTCKGIVIRNTSERPDFFAGVLKNHRVKGEIDIMTGLKNQYAFLDDINKNLSNKVEFRISMLGIRGFSEINELYGYDFGNLVIQRFGRVLFEHVGGTGIVYRLDGTKFAVISSLLTVEEMRERYDDVRRIFREGIIIDEKHILLNLSAGVLTVDTFDVNDQTVYACLNYIYSESKLKENGDFAVFKNSLTEDNNFGIERLYTIRTSIPHGFKGFYLLYQPVVDAHNEKLIGAEALLRWKDDKFGVVSPNDFIPVIEQDPLYEELGKWILKTAIVDAKPMIDRDPDFYISVNLAYSQIEKPDFVDSVINILNENDFDPKNLCLEITERCRFVDEELLKNVIVQLRGNGIKVALDDFGTGFSAVGLVKDMPFDTIKIDRSFVLNIEENERERKLIENFTNIASTFGAGVCVEGIENSNMRDILRDYSVKSFQGYFYSKPLYLEALREWSIKREDRQ